MSERAVQGQRLAELAVPAPLGKRRVRGTSAWRRFLRNRMAMGALAVLALFGLVTAFVPLVVPEAKVTEQVRSATFAPPSGDAWFGRDEFGRDAFIRAVYGGRISLWVSFASAIIATVIGVLFGMVAGYAGGWIDAVVDRFV